jgi:tRNA modification GTPase
MLYDDTIVAIATPPGEGGIGVVRLSGKDALPILTQIFQVRRAGRWRPYRMRLGRVVGADQRPIDEALAVYMRAPHSFTGEDTVEISCHGGGLILTRVVGRAIELGARQAGPGEFTMRAFMSGRIDLTQAEATLDVITARTQAGLALAQAQLGGWLAAEIRRVRELLLGPLAYCTALVDFPEDEVEPQPIEAPLHAAIALLERLVESADQGIVYREGARAVLVGRPNAGKSSLLNQLLRSDRAIVTPIPGTTRDTLAETANLEGVPVVLIDTAGITASHDPVEQIGVGRSRAALGTADLALMVVDVSAPPDQADADIAAETRGRPTILVANKRDLVAGPVELGAWGAALGREPFDAALAVSARTGEGIDDLGRAIAGALLHGAPGADSQLVTNPRHREALGGAAEHVRDALASQQRGATPDLLAIDLTAALQTLGEITGESLHEELLHAIFSRFCIGK